MATNNDKTKGKKETANPTASEDDEDKQIRSQRIFLIVAGSFMLVSIVAIVVGLYIFDRDQPSIFDKDDAPTTTEGYKRRRRDADVEQFPVRRQQLRRRHSFGAQNATNRKMLLKMLLATD